MAAAVLTAGASIYAGNQDAKRLRKQGQQTANQAYADEENSRRDASLLLGEQAAAFSQAGGGIDEGVVRQSAVNAEYNALTIRHKGLMAKDAYRAEAKSAVTKGYVMAGQALLSGAQTASSGL